MATAVRKRTGRPTAIAVCKRRSRFANRARLPTACNISCYCCEFCGAWTFSPRGTLFSSCARFAFCGPCAILGCCGHWFCALAQRAPQAVRRAGNRSERYAWSHAQHSSRCSRVWFCPLRCTWVWPCVCLWFWSPASSPCPECRPRRQGLRAKAVCAGFLGSTTGPTEMTTAMIATRATRMRVVARRKRTTTRRRRRKRRRG
jgi:hypothetical protein